MTCTPPLMRVSIHRRHATVSDERLGLVTIPSTLVSSRTTRLTKRFLLTQVEIICERKGDLRQAYERSRHQGLRFHQLLLRSTVGTFQLYFRPFPAQPEQRVHPELRAHTAREADLGDQPLAST